MVTESFSELWSHWGQISLYIHDFVFFSLILKAMSCDDTTSQFPWTIIRVHRHRTTWIPWHLFQRPDNIPTKLRYLDTLATNLAKHSETRKYISTTSTIQRTLAKNGKFDREVTHLRQAQCSIRGVFRESLAAERIQEVPPYLLVVNAAVALRKKEGIFRHEVGEAKFAPLMFTCTALARTREVRWVK